MRKCFVYLLESTNHSTYIGATLDLDHRLRQHNMEIKGGARATNIKVKRENYGLEYTGGIKHGLKH